MLSKQKLTLKVASTTILYNLLQDLRHLVIMDFRAPEEFKESHIRKSINVKLDDYQMRLTGALAGPKEVKHPYRSHFEGDDLLRVVCIVPNPGWK